MLPGPIATAMDLGPWRREFDVALEATREAATLARDIHRQIGAHTLLKADRSPVTVADFAVQALVGHRMRQAFPASLRSPTARLTLQSVLDVLHAVAPDLEANRVLDAIDRGRGMPGDEFDENESLASFDSLRTA